MKGWLIISYGDILLNGLNSNILLNKSINYGSLSRPKQSCFLSNFGKSFKTACYFWRIFLPSRPYTPNKPKPIIDFPFYVEILPLRDSHNGNPVNISSIIAPKDHISYDHGCNLLHKLPLLVPFASVFCALLSKYSRTSGARYSGVLA